MGKPFMSMGGNMMLSILVITIGVLQGSLALNFERQLTGELLENYCSSARPVKNDSDTVELKLGLTLQQILDVDTNVQTMTGGMSTWPGMKKNMAVYMI